jgi:hypothetical protein
MTQVALALVSSEIILNIRLKSSKMSCLIGEPEGWKSQLFLKNVPVGINYPQDFTWAESAKLWLDLSMRAWSCIYFGWQKLKGPSYTREEKDLCPPFHYSRRFTVAQFLRLKRKSRKNKGKCQLCALFRFLLLWPHSTLITSLLQIQPY